MSVDFWVLMGAAGWRNGVLKSLGKRRGGFDIGEFRWEVLGRLVGGWVTVKNVLVWVIASFNFRFGRAR